MYNNQCKGPSEAVGLSDLRGARLLDYLVAISPATNLSREDWPASSSLIEVLCDSQYLPMELVG